MEATIVIVEAFLLLKWRGSPTLKGLRLMEEKVFALQQQNRRPITLVIVAPDEIKPPSLELRSELKKIFVEMAHALSSVHLVIEGQGIRHSLKRMIVAGMILISEVGYKITIHNTLNESLTQLAARGIPTSNFQRALRESGLL